MRRLTLASVLLLVGGAAMLAALPLEWTSVTFPEGTTSTMHGTDYAGYDVATTVVLGLAVMVGAFAVAAARRWGRALSVIVAVFACLWGTLVVVAAANPSADGTALSGVTAAVGPGAYAVAAGASLALIGAVTSLRGRNVGAATAGVPASV
jgi:hypothetical protein